MEAVWWKCGKRGCKCFFMIIIIIIITIIIIFIIIIIIEFSVLFSLTLSFLFIIIISRNITYLPFLFYSFYHPLLFFPPRVHTWSRVWVDNSFHSDMKQKHKQQQRFIKEKMHK